MPDRTNTASYRTAPPAYAGRAAVTQERKLCIADLRHLSPLNLDSLLIDEEIEWELALDWDFSRSADLVRKLFNAGRLCGRAIVDGGDVAAYGYAGLEGRKGVIGDVYLRPAWRRGNFEEVLLRKLFDALIATPRVSRIESQLMLVEEASAQSLRNERMVELFERFLMTLDADTLLPPGARSTRQRFFIEPWGSNHPAAAATVVSAAYGGHIDGRINDRYRTLAGADHYLQQLIHFPGCAAFYAPASYVAFDVATGSVAGVSLSSFIAPDVAHIAELCVMPNARRAGLGYELLRKSTETLRSAGAKRVSLTVTGANEPAVKLYRRCGFRQVRRFYAYVWERSLNFGCSPYKAESTGR
jgi:ribosomal protein S18 acetylase RimI-like enzyme